MKMSNYIKKVCFLIPSVKSGGIETYLLRFLQHNREKINATVLVRIDSKGELYDDYLATGANIIFKPLGYLNIQSMIWYFKFFKTEKFDTICDFNGNFAGIPMLVSKSAGIEKRITFYRQGSDHFKKSVFKRLYNSSMNKLVYKYSTAILANSIAGLAFFFPNQYQKDDRFKVIKNGVNTYDFLESASDKKKLRKELALPEDAYIIGHTGRFTEAKNHYFLLDVVQKLMEVDDSIHLVLIGNDTNKLIPYINQLKIQERCIVLGYQSTIPKYLKTFDMFFFPSVTEGQPNALIEAMISGLPIVASNIAAIKECLPKNRQDCLIDPNNVIMAVEKVKEVKENATKYTFVKHAVSNFDAEIQFGEFMETL